MPVQARAPHLHPAHSGRSCTKDCMQGCNSAMFPVSEHALPLAGRSRTRCRSRSWLIAAPDTPAIRSWSTATHLASPLPYTGVTHEPKLLVRFVGDRDRDPRTRAETVTFGHGHNSAEERERALLVIMSITGWSRARPGDRSYRRCMALSDSKGDPSEREREIY